jgi:SET domain-containing protein
MLLVRTYVAPSGLHGLGVYAAEPIAKGQTIWRFVAGFDQVIPEEVAKTWPPAAWDFLMKYSYVSPHIEGGFVLDGDHSRFLNHSKDANTENSTPETIARRDIAEGEEITVDYDQIALGWELLA